MALLSSLMGKREEAVPKVTPAHLEQLLTDIESERRTLESVLSAASKTDLSSVHVALGQVEERASSLARQLDELGTRAARLADAARGADVLEQRFTALEQRFCGIEGRIETAAQQTAQAASQREALEEAVTHAQQAVSRLESLQADSDIARLAAQVPAIKEECIRIREQHSALLNDADALTTKTSTVFAGGDVGSRRVPRRRSPSLRRSTADRRTAAQGRWRRVSPRVVPEHHSTAPDTEWPG